MEEQYLKDYNILEKSDKDVEIELIKSIIRVREDLKNANKNFEFAEEELIDYYTYEIKANQSKLDYLLKKAKTKGISLDMINEIKFRLYKENNEAV